jgi:menaquinone-dependent protoporphyrinogen oxidase
VHEVAPSVELRARARRGGAATPRVRTQSVNLQEEPMSDVLILYASKHGHTAKIAARIADTMRADGVSVDLQSVDAAHELSPDGYGAVVVGASIHAGHHQREIVDWAKHHQAALAEKPTAFFSVCLAVADDTDEARAAARKYIDDFEDETGWTADTSTTFAGALQYLEYDFMTRTLMRLIMRRDGHPTDTSRDFDYTDWDAVERFGHECAGKVEVST